MREILFRGKHRDTGEWLFFGLFCTDMHYIERDTIGQHTGLQDCTGNPIYEGDILKDPEYGSTVIVEWKGDGFVARYENGVEIALANINEYYDVIGNIHDKEG